MNRQVSDTIIVDGKSFRLYSNPLEGYLERGDPRPVFAAFNTAIWRGYVARWEVFDSRLFLTGLFGRGRMVPSHLIAKLPTNIRACRPRREIPASGRPFSRASAARFR
jgi:hypothetical protein